MNFNKFFIIFEIYKRTNHDSANLNLPILDIYFLNLNIVVFRFINFRVY